MRRRKTVRIPYSVSHNIILPVSFPHAVHADQVKRDCLESSSTSNKFLFSAVLYCIHTKKLSRLKSGVEFDMNDIFYEFNTPLLRQVNFWCEYGIRFIVSPSYGSFISLGLSMS